MTEKIDFDAYIMKWLGFKDFGEYQQFFAHLLLHSTLTFFFMSIVWWLGFISLAFAVFKELYIDSHYKQWDKDATQDMVSRCVGSLLPFITLAWN